MKESSYNHFIENNKSVICFNAFRNSYMTISKTLYNEFNTYKSDLNTLQKNNVTLFKNLENNGFIIPDDLNEREVFISQQLDRRFSSKSYHIILNMTMDCNLRCWYCYEDHIYNSQISDEIINSTLKHIDLKLKTNPFKNLTFSFFGGEPLLYKNKVLEVLNKLKAFSTQKDFKLNVNFTTNGTLIDKEILYALKDINTGFQITLDGHKSVHDKIRKYKDNSRSSYEQILSSLKLIRETLENYQIALRINVSPSTINGIEKIIPDIKEVLPPQKSKITIYKVWQVNAEKINEEIINNFVSECQKNGFNCSYLKLNYCLSSCYADNYNQVVINYNGLVYKCTARKFNNANSCGYLTPNGMIVWDYSKLINRMSLKIPEKCMNCDILPVCHKICSQNLLETDNASCILNDNFSKEDYIIQTLNNILIQR